MNCGKSTRHCNRKGQSTKTYLEFQALEFSKPSKPFLINSLHRMSSVNSCRMNEHLRYSRLSDQNKILLSGARSWTEWETESHYGLINRFKSLVQLFLAIDLYLISQSLQQIVILERVRDWQILETENAVCTTV